MVAALLVLGTVAEGAAWWAVARRGASVWTVLAPLLVLMGALALLTGRVGPGRVEPGAAVAAGLASGLALYGATRAFLGVVARGWPALAADVDAVYGRRGALPRWGAVAVSALLVAPGEELFWRGLLLAELERALGRGPGAAALAWAVALLPHAPAGSLAIGAGAAVGGALWVTLAAWSGGVLASVASHAAWTALMLAFPPRIGGGPGRMP